MAITLFLYALAREYFRKKNKKMKIVINDKDVEILNGESLLDAAERIGCKIPSLCYYEGKKHKSSCMVCAVKNQTNGQIIPSCSTYPEEGMRIETESEEILTIRKLSLELLLSDHRADCEAPCALVCPNGLEIEQLLSYYDANQLEKAFALIAETFSLPEIACDTCKAPCEKACRRGSIDNAVSIRDIIKEVAEMKHEMSADKEITKQKTDKNSFQSRVGRFSSSEKERLIATVTTPSRCLHCACAGRSDCKLRVYATTEGIKRSRYDVTSAMPALHRQQINENMVFEQAKCIRCGLCVYYSENGFTFKDRGFGMSIVLPEENRQNIKEELATLCPTGAIH